MPWTCEQTEDRLIDVLEGSLGPAEQAEMENHLAACSSCVALAGSVRKAIDRLHQLQPAEPDPSLVPRILERTTGAKPARRRLAWLDLVWQPRFALGVVTVLITFSILFHATSSGVSASLADMNPIYVYRQINRRTHLVYARGVKFVSDLRVVYEIQSRFQPEPQTGSADTPQKKSSYEFERLFYRRLESRARPATKSVHGDRHEMRYPS